MDPAHLLAVKKIVLTRRKRRVVNRDNGFDRCVEDTERERTLALGRQWVTATQRLIGQFYLSSFNVLKLFIFYFFIFFNELGLDVGVVGFTAIKLHRPIRSDSCRRERL